MFLWRNKKNYPRINTKYSSLIPLAEFYCIPGGSYILPWFKHIYFRTIYIALWLPFDFLFIYFFSKKPIHTVAGEATSRSMGSNIKLVVGASWIISPLIKQSFLLSSSTVFMFSIQMASTGPSNISHFLSGVCQNKIYLYDKGLGNKDTF